MHPADRRLLEILHGAIARALFRTDNVMPCERMGRNSLPLLDVYFAIGHAKRISEYQVRRVQDLSIGKTTIWLT